MVYVKLTESDSISEIILRKKICSYIRISLFKGQQDWRLDQYRSTGGIWKMGNIWRKGTPIQPNRLLYNKLIDNQNPI